MLGKARTEADVVFAGVDEGDVEQVAVAFLLDQLDVSYVDAVAVVGDVRWDEGVR